MSQLRIQDLPEEERPREKALKSGVGALTSPELMALLLRTGKKGMNAIELGAKVLKDFGGLPQLFRHSLDDLLAYDGLGEAKALELAAAIELGNRARKEPAAGVSLDTPERVFNLVAPDMQYLPVEVLRVLLINTRLQLVGERDIFRGSVNESIAHPREIFAPAIRRAAYGMVIVHNHPSGDPSPSEADLRLTRRLTDAADILQIRLLDHLIIGLPAEGRQPFYSFREAGLL